MTDSIVTTIQTDSKGRIYLGDIAKGITTFRVTRDGDQRIILEPEQIPEQEKWLFENPIALASVRRGIQQSQEGHTVPAREDFTQYIDNEE